METYDDLVTFIPVKEVDWSDSTICRAGVIPIVIENNEKWIGLCISKYNTSIGTFGGTYDIKDRDLLDTAVREFNEEFGNNITPINFEDLVNCYALKSNYSISIFLPFPERIKCFNSTKEVYDLLWVTSKHLLLMMNCRNLILDYHNTRTSRCKAFLLSYDLERIALSVCRIVNSRSDYYLIKDTPLVRTKRCGNTAGYTYVTELDSFLRDVATRHHWSRSCIIINDKNVIIYHKDRVVYILPNSNKSHIFIPFGNTPGHIFNFIVGNNSDVHKLSHFNKPDNVVISSMKQYAYHSKVPHVIPKNYDSLLSHARTSNDVMDELQLLSECELKVYQEVSNQGIYFNEKRASFLKRVKFTINTRFNSRRDLISKLRLKFGKSEPSPYLFVDFAIKNGIITI